MAEKKPDVYDRTKEKDALAMLAFYVKENTLDVLDIATAMGKPDLDPEAAEALALKWTQREFDENNRCTSRGYEGFKFKDWATAIINNKPSLVGLGNGAEIQDMNKADLYRAFGPEKNRTVLTRLVQKHGLPKVNAAARAGMLVDAFDVRSEYRVPGHTARAGEVEDKKPVHQSGEINPWLPHTFNLTAQAKLFLSDPTKAKKLMDAAGVTRVGMTQKEILRGAR